MAKEFIRIGGARQHNLKNLSLSIPRDKLVVITGLSGSGKSSLAFDTIYAENSDFRSEVRPRKSDGASQLLALQSEAEKRLEQ
jgi:excinuclease UvrABC ATPase subunit